MKTCDAAGKVIKLETHSYNEKGNLVKYVLDSFDWDLKIMREYIQHDDKGNVIEIKDYIVAGVSFITSKYEYTYYE